MIYARALGEALGRALAEDPRTVLLGEDIADPYGGAFKVTRGLSTAHPDRVRTTPISEGAMAGVAAGLALHGYRPILEIMFGDFVTLTFDQVVNHMTKYQAMYAEQVTCPVVIRTPTGGGRGYGPTHSQSLEKHLVGVPHLQVVAASLHHPPDEVLGHLLGQDRPALHVEHKLLYPLHVATPGPGDEPGGPAADGSEQLLVSRAGSPGRLPTVRLSAVPTEECTVTVVAYGYQAVLAARAVHRLAVDQEVFAELLVPAHLAPVDWAPIEASVAATGALVTVEEGTAGWSWGTGVAEHVGRRLFGRLRRAPEVLASAADIIPSARDLEEAVLVGDEDIERAIEEAA